MNPCRRVACAGFALWIAASGCQRSSVRGTPIDTEPGPAQSIAPSEPAPREEAAIERLAPQPISDGVITLAPGIRVDRLRREVLIDASVPIHAQQAGRRVYLEVLLCSPDTREHETLLVTRARASLVHAGLLMLGLEAGTCGVWTFEGTRAMGTPPKGPEVEVLVRRMVDGQPIEEPLSAWVIDARTGSGIEVSHPNSSWVFTGSRFRRAGTNENSPPIIPPRDVYEADAEGTIVGLTTFGNETIAWSVMHHPDSSVEGPSFVADPVRMPEFNTRVTVVIRPRMQ
jgi:hypothetical protein